MSIKSLSKRNIGNIDNLFDNNLRHKLQKYHYRFGLWGGFLKLLKKVLVKTVKPIISYHEAFILNKIITDSKNEISPGVELKVDFLSPSDFTILEKISHNDDQSFIEKRLKNGEKCFVAKHNGELCAYVWVAPGKRVVFYGAKRIRVGAKEVYFHDGLTMPSYRGRSIAPFLRCHVGNFLKDKGYHRAIVLVHSDNFSSIRSLKKAGFTIYEIVRFIKLFFLKKDLCLTTKVK